MYNEYYKTYIKGEITENAKQMKQNILKILNHQLYKMSFGSIKRFLKIL